MPHGVELGGGGGGVGSRGSSWLVRDPGCPVPCSVTLLAPHRDCLDSSPHPHLRSKAGNLTCGFSLIKPWLCLFLGILEETALHSISPSLSHV